MHFSDKPIGVIYSHEEQFNPLFAQLQKNGLPYELIDPSQQYFDPAKIEMPFSLLINDMSSPPYQKRNPGTTLEYLRHVEGLNSSAGIVNGSRIAEVFSSRTRQLNTLATLGFAIPKTCVVYGTEQFLKSVHRLKFPILISQNESSSNWRRFESEEALITALIQDQLNFDSAIWIVREYIPAKTNHSVRVEMLNGRFLYAVKVFNAGDSTESWSIETRMEAFTPSQQIIGALEKIARKSLMDVGSIEYLTDRRTNEILFLSIQPHTSSYSQPVSGLDCNINEHIAQYITQRLRKVREIELAI